MTQRTLLVEPDASRRALLANYLASDGRDIVAVETFGEAREHLKATPFDVIVTATRLGAFNGLHLVLLARASYPSIRAVVTTPVADEILEREAASFAAGYVAAPWQNLDRLQAVIARAAEIQSL